ncbi:MAG: glycosyltransferase family 4 protein [Ignavibacteria bacterium]
MKVLYVTSNGGIHDYRFLEKLTDDYEVLLLHYSAREIINEIRSLKELKIVTKRPLIHSFPYLSERRHFKQIYKDFKPDITHTGYVWQVGILASNANVHPHLSMVWGSDVLTEPDKNWYFKRLVRKVMLQADHIQCDAEFVKKKIISDYSVLDKKITVFPWGINLNKFRLMDKNSCRSNLKLNPDKFIIIYDRFLEPVYGVKDLLEGFKLFCENKNDIQLIMVSVGSLKKYVKRFITENNLESKIRLMERVANAELPVLLNASDVYISTALSDGTSLSLLEAMACGKPVIVTDIPSIREWVHEENGIVVPIKDHIKLRSALETYYNNRELIVEHGKNNIKVASNYFNWDLNYIRLKELYLKIL